MNEELEREPTPEEWEKFARALSAANYGIEQAHAVIERLQAYSEQQASALDAVSTQWVELHTALSTALGLEFEPDEDIERYIEAIGNLQKTEAERDAAVADAAFLREKWEEMIPASLDGMTYNAIMRYRDEALTGSGAAFLERLRTAEAERDAALEALRPFAIWWLDVISLPTNTYMRPNAAWPSHEQIKAAATVWIDKLKG